MKALALLFYLTLTDWLTYRIIVTLYSGYMFSFKYILVSITIKELNYESKETCSIRGLNSQTCIKGITQIVDGCILFVGQFKLSYSLYKICLVKRLS